MLEKVHIDIIGPMPAKSVGGREYAYTVVEGYTLVVYTRPLQLKLEAADAFKSFREAENKSGSRLRAVNDRQHAQVVDGRGARYLRAGRDQAVHPASNGMTERTIGVLTNAARAML